MLQRCPKCDHHPLPENQAFPVECPGCGVILARVEPHYGPRESVSQVSAAAESVARARRDALHFGGLDSEFDSDDAPGLAGVLLHVPVRVDHSAFWGRVVLLVGLAVWGFRLIRMNYSDGEMGSSPIHGPLLLFHEAGHVIFGFMGEWVRVLGGTLGQLVMPAILGGALLWKNRDPFGAAVGLWLFGVSVLDISPYMYDALEPQLMLTTGATGEEGGHDWIYLFRSMHVLQRAQGIGAFTHAVGGCIVLLALAWAAWVLKLQHARVEEYVLREK